MLAPGAMSTRFTVRPLICIPRIARACSSASSGVLASLTPPALPRPPAFTWALTTTTPSCSAAALASSGVVATMPFVTGTSCLAKSSFAWYSIRSTCQHLFLSSEWKAVPTLDPRPGVGSVGVGVGVPQRRPQVLVELRDDVERDLLGARRGALTDVRAAAEALVVVLRDHAEHAGVPLGLALRQLTEVGDLRAEEQRRRGVGARRDAGAAADAGRGVESAVRVALGHRDGVRVRGR